MKTSRLKTVLSSVPAMGISLWRRKLPGEGGLYHLAVAGKHGLERGDAVARVDVTEQQFAAITGKTPSEVLTGTKHRLVFR